MKFGVIINILKFTNISYCRKSIVASPAYVHMYIIVDILFFSISWVAQKLFREKTKHKYFDMIT
jgi:hypothetical protein